MKKLQRLFGLIVLSLAFTLSAFAGEMGFPGATTTPPPPPSPSATGDIGTPGLSSTGDVQAPASAVDPAMEALFALLRSTLFLF